MKERRRRHDDAHMPLGGKGKRANSRRPTLPPRAVLVPVDYTEPQERRFAEVTEPRARGRRKGT